MMDNEVFYDNWGDDYDDYPEIYDVEILEAFVLLEVDGYMVAHEHVKEIWIMTDGEFEVCLRHIPVEYTTQMPPYGHPAWKQFDDIPF